MVKLVNEVASIVHESVVKNLGAPNNNIGDAFLVLMRRSHFSFCVFTHVDVTAGMETKRIAYNN